MANTAYQRLLAPNYADEIHSMPVSRSRNPLPSARLLSYKVFGRDTIPDPHFTLLNMQWGQLIAHDTSLHLENGVPGLKPLEEKLQICCNTSGRYEKRMSALICRPIPVPKDDPYLKGKECIDFGRSVTDKDFNCPRTKHPTHAEQLNGNTHYLDLSFVYGSSGELSYALRLFDKGLLRTNDFRRKWPPRPENPESQCPLGRSGGICYEFGDIRGNQNPGLTVLQIVFLREHNRLARELRKLNSHWDDETLFQEARRINIAQFQYISYYEWSLVFFGNERMRRYDLIFNTHNGEYVNDYDPHVQLRSIQSFQHAAFRYFHDQIVGLLHLVPESREFTNDTLRLLNLINRPALIEKGCKYNSFLRGLSTQPAKLTDTNFDTEITDRSPGELRSVDIQRARDHGLATYNDFREYCGLKRAKSWQDYLDYIPEKHLDLLKTIYESFEDVELSIGGALEQHEPDALLGPTFLCINILQFKILRKGDRYFFENGNQPYPFTKGQLKEIRKANAARLLCDNANVEHMQPMAFKRISESNPLQPCGVLPRIDLKEWLDLKWYLQQNNLDLKEISQCPIELDKCINPSTVTCTHARYRTMDGSCNNPRYPTLGMAGTTYNRLLPAKYSDGKSSIRLSKSGKPLPSPRLLSYKVFGREVVSDPKRTLLTMQWGQLVTHDITLHLQSKCHGESPLTEKIQKCCNESGRFEYQNTSLKCDPLAVPPDDPFFKRFECLIYFRSLTDGDIHCPGAESTIPADHPSGVTHYLDLSFVYGDSRNQSRQLRVSKKGLLKATERTGHEWPL
ncbi:unnamed protein product [Hermetia illucens]|uniref:Peroxidase n=1 Tax=Hermetia illucens TaxID=343691 RepID=A0A7R8UBU1_HERIL|nr:unnamed protein product [Hermetia illucens]